MRTSAGSDATVFFDGIPDQIIQRGHRLDARKAAAPDHKCKEGAACLLVCFNGGAFQERQGAIQRRGGIGQTVHADRVFRYAGQAVVVRHGSHGDYKLIEIERARSGGNIISGIPYGDGDLLSRQVDFCRLSHQKGNAR